jgi:translation elongation factor EF-Tu-like GTPase
MAGLALPWRAAAPRLSWRALSSSAARHREDFVRARTNVNAVTLGASQHGKTLLCARLSLALAGHGVPPRTVQDIDHLAGEREDGGSQAASHLQLWARGPSQPVFSMADLPGSPSYVKNCLAYLAHADLALLVVNTDLGLEPHAAALFHIARHLGVPGIVPVVTQPAPDPETLELVLLELAELEGLEGEPVVVTDLAGEGAGLEGLLEVLEARVEAAGLRPREEDGPLLMALEQVESWALDTRPRWEPSPAEAPSAPAGSSGAPSGSGTRCRPAASC